jgi:hypothetical protein
MLVVRSPYLFSWVIVPFIKSNVVPFCVCLLIIVLGFSKTDRRKMVEEDSEPNFSPPVTPTSRLNNKSSIACGLASRWKITFR